MDHHEPKFGFDRTLHGDEHLCGEIRPALTNRRLSNVLRNKGARNKHHLAKNKFPLFVGQVTVKSDNAESESDCLFKCDALRYIFNSLLIVHSSQLTMN